LRDLVGSLLRNSCQGFEGFFVGHGCIPTGGTEALVYQNVKEGNEIPARCEAALWHSIGTHGLVLGPALLAIMARFAGAPR
jgi:hypothetical protein